ncbi:hypothetical protein SAMN05216559_1084 [Halomicrobium zhouii]|uniref:Uncharacterized protein n=1 Tax=Halomicrobium zhouii TaxID=767519 RepID=A0A1I6KMQ8_9EURY|nr:hypothetical protein [Halomicrobium zhouii]SFR92496.1 hypothetical protein SAMN05216559_1084 [Halomicrobium zhouii]
MTRDELATASDLLASAADSTDDEDDAERLDGLSGQLSDLAEAERGPDHGRLARIENALNDLEASAGDDAAGTIADAHEHVTEYRSGVEGV